MKQLTTKEFGSMERHPPKGVNKKANPVSWQISYVTN